MSAGLWSWAVAAYETPGVAGACLDLQDAQGQNVPLLLWAAWAAATGRPVDGETIEAACDTARVWDETAVAPLRAVRRALKTRRPDMDDDAREAVRTQVKAIELEAERHLLQALEDLTPPGHGSARPVLPALTAVSRQWGPVTPRTALALLADRLPA